MASGKNAALFSTLAAKAETLACITAKNQFPVLLRPLAERRRVTSVEFRPLLVDAMLTTHPQGFRILFNSGTADALKLNEQFKNESCEHVLPSRLRFSLSHEIAHTLFYDLSDGTPKIARHFRSGGGRTELENLEQSCNKLAAVMLLPTAMLRVALAAMKAVNPEALIGLARSAGVSIEALVRRLCDQNALLTDPYFRGCIILAKETQEHTTVTAMARPPRLNIARGLQIMRPGERWQLVSSDGTPIDPKRLPKTSEVTLSVETQQSNLQHIYRICQEEAGRTSSAVSRLLTFEEVER